LLSPQLQLRLKRFSEWLRYRSTQQLYHLSPLPALLAETLERENRQDDLGADHERSKMRVTHQDTRMGLKARMDLLL
jgi:hypothetical protein